MTDMNWELSTRGKAQEYTHTQVKVNSSCSRPRRPRGGGEVQLYSFFNLGVRWGLVVNATPRPLYPRERDPVPIVQEARWAKNLAPTQIRSPDRPARTESLYRLGYPGSHTHPRLVGKRKVKKNILFRWKNSIKVVCKRNVIGRDIRYVAMADLKGARH